MKKIGRDANICADNMGEYDFLTHLNNDWPWFYFGIQFASLQQVLTFQNYLLFEILFYYHLVHSTVNDLLVFSPAQFQDQ